jgi:glycosyltransferase involved in cell wall biosynthesis
MKVSIIVPTYNRIDQLRRCVDSLNSLRYSNNDHEICVVNDGSSDGTRRFLNEQASTVSNLRVIHQENQGVAAARNAGIDATTGEYVFSTDDDCIVPPDWIQQHLDRHEQYDVDGVNGQQWPIETNIVEAFKIAIYWQEHEESHMLNDPDSVVGATTNNLSYRREVFETVGGFDTSLRRGSDPEHSKRVLESGFTILKDPHLRVEHMKTDTLQSHLRNSYYQGKGRSIREKKHGEDEHNPRTNWVYRLHAWKKFYDQTGLLIGWSFPLLALASRMSVKLGELSGGW